MHSIDFCIFFVTVLFIVTYSVAGQQIIWLSPGQSVNGVLTNQTSLASTIFAWNKTVGFEHSLLLQQSQKTLTILVAADTIPTPFFFLFASQNEVVVPSCASGTTFYATFTVDTVTSLPQSYTVTLNLTDTVIERGKVLSGSTKTQRFFTFTNPSNTSLPFVTITNTRSDFPTSFFVFRVMSSCSPFATPLFDSGVILPTQRRLDFPLNSAGDHFILLDPGVTPIPYTITVGMNTVIDIEPVMFNGTEYVPAITLGPSSPSVLRYFHVVVPTDTQFSRSLFIDLQRVPGDVYIKFNSLPTLYDPSAFYYPSTTVVNIPPCALYPGDWYFGIYSPIPGLQITVAVGYIPVVPLTVGGSYVSTSAGRTRWHQLLFDSNSNITIQTMLFAFMSVAEATIGVGTDCDIITSQNVSVTSTVLPVSGGNVSFQLSANVLYWIQVDPGVTSAVTYRISGCGHANFSLLPLFTSLILMICFSIGNNL